MFPANETLAYLIEREEWQLQSRQADRLPRRPIYFDSVNALLKWMEARRVDGFSFAFYAAFKGRPARLGAEIPAGGEWDAIRLETEWIEEAGKETPTLDAIRVYPVWAWEIPARATIIRGR